MKLAQNRMAKRPARFLSTGCKSLRDDADLGADTMDFCLRVMRGEKHPRYWWAN